MLTATTEICAAFLLGARGFFAELMEESAPPLVGKGETDGVAIGFSCVLLPNPP